ncbi:macro domain-containing protein [Paenibacillus polymyxa]|jgi:O-acetyl-ADP-ribose deacetylase (regulator of RNase III)|uniref:Appr-1-p processing protein n=1 Tax=Paenibacillus polymyxa TaxID=1406 RepID=A0ABX2ZAD2_PAEPO|nr:macro domain-containing protein [Paenibacillus polymyxa]ODA08255.1 Appr-1-p processing protein [Paenibacillus polymyxa]
MIKIIEGNLLNATEDIIGHQTNTKGVWGSGVAKSIKDKYPHTYPTYCAVCSDFGDRLLGDCWTIRANENKIIANLFGQTNYGRDKNMVYTKYDALKLSLESLEYRAKKFGWSVALPYNIGCGLANGDWNIVYEIIDEVFRDYEVTLYRT